MAIEDLREEDLKTIGKSDADKLVIETYALLGKYKNCDARRQWVNLLEECWTAAIDNEFFTDDEKKAAIKMGQPLVSYNKLNKGVQGSAAIVTDSKPEIKFHPIGSGDLYVAELLKRGHDVVWEKNEGNDKIYDAVEQRSIGAQAFIEAKHNPSKGPFGRLVIEENDPTIYFWSKDSRAKDLSDTTIIKAQLRSRAYIEANYDDIKADDLTFSKTTSEGPDETGDRTDTVEGEDNYARNPDESDPDAIIGKRDVKNIWEVEAWILKVEKEDWLIYFKNGEKSPRTAKIELEKGQKVADVIKEFSDREDVEFAKHWPRRLNNRYLRIIVGKKIIMQTVKDAKGDTIEVKERLNPYGLDSDGDPVIPIITLKGQRTRTSYCKSATFYAKDANKHLCKREAQFTYAASMALSAPLAQPKGSVWVKGEPGTPGSIVEYSKSDEKPSRIPAENLDLNGLSFLIAEDKEYINDQYDLQDVMRGKPPKGQENASGRLVLALQDLAGMMSKPSLRSLESMIVRLGKVNMAIILQNWPRYMWERLLEEDEWETLRPNKAEGTEEEPQEGTEEELKLREETRQKWEEALELIRPLDPAAPPGIGLIDIDVKVTSGSSLPTNRMAKDQIANEKYKIGLYDRKAALKYADDPEAEAISKRMDERDAQLAAQGIKK